MKIQAEADADRKVLSCLDMGTLPWKKRDKGMSVWHRYSVWWKKRGYWLKSQLWLGCDSV